MTCCRCSPALCHVEHFPEVVKPCPFPPKTSSGNTLTCIFCINSIRVFASIPSCLCGTQSWNTKQKVYSTGAIRVYRWPNERTTILKWFINAEMLRPSIFPVIFSVWTRWMTPCIYFLSQMHVVHFNSDKYANISMAVDKSDGLAVLGVLIEVRAYREGLDQKDQPHKQIVYIKSASLWYRSGSSTQHLTSSLSMSMGLNTKVSFTLMVISIQNQK